MPAKFLKYILPVIILFQMVMFAQEKEIVAYYYGGAAYNSFYVKNIKTSGSADKITVLIYAFAVPGPDSTRAIVPLINSNLDYEQPYSPAMSIDGIADDSTQPLRGLFNQLKKLKTENPKMKIMLSIGGWGGCNYYSDAALTAESREKFVDACINEFILGNLPVKGNAGGLKAAAGIFDGIDLDWEFPLSGGPEGTHYNKNDVEDLTELLALFRKKLDAVNPDLLLTIAIAADKPNLNNYDIKGIQQYLNWFNLMTYDFHGSWNNAAAHHTNLLSSPLDTTDNGAEHSFDKSVKYFIDSMGVNSRKIIPGAGFYGKCWYNVDSVNHGLYQPGSDSAGIYKEGSGDYSNLRTFESKGYNYYWDSLAMAPWLYNPEKKIFWTFDDPKSIALKSRYVDAYNLGGLMFWELSEDDSTGTLVNTIFTSNMPDIKFDKNKDEKSSPSVKIVQPDETDAIYTGSNVIINTTQADNGSTILKVEFYVDDMSIGYDTKAPFDWVWFNVPEGRHKLKVVATDSNGHKAVSKIKNVMVKAGI
jgi:chitinase